MSLPVTVYTPESPLRNPAKLLAQMFRDMLATILKSPQATQSVPPLA